MPPGSFNRYAAKLPQKTVQAVRVPLTDMALKLRI
jgi:hypothetical protein